VREGGDGDYVNLALRIKVLGGIIPAVKPNKRIGVVFYVGKDRVKFNLNT
jgi:hypothetical protein